VQGVHPPVPPSKIQSIIPFKELVVHIMIDRCVEPFEEPVPVKTLGKDLKTQVAIYIVNRHKYEKSKKVYEVNGKAESKHINNG
jgi:hypothetical protein